VRRPNRVEHIDPQWRIVPVCNLLGRPGSITAHLGYSGVCVFAFPAGRIFAFFCFELRNVRLWKTRFFGCDHLRTAFIQRRFGCMAHHKSVDRPSLVGDRLFRSCIHLFLAPSFRADVPESPYTSQPTKTCPRAHVPTGPVLWAHNTPRAGFVSRCFKHPSY